MRRWIGNPKDKVRRIKLPLQVERHKALLLGVTGSRRQESNEHTHRAPDAARAGCPEKDIQSRSDASGGGRDTCESLFVCWVTRRKESSGETWKNKAVVRDQELCTGCSEKESCRRWQDSVWGFARSCDNKKGKRLSPRRPKCWERKVIEQASMWKSYPFSSTCKLS